MSRNGSDRDQLDADDRATRRRVLRSSALLGAVGTLAGCGSSPQEESTGATGSPTEGDPGTGTPDSTPRSTRAADPPADLEPPDEPGPIDEKYPGLRVLSTAPPVGETSDRGTYASFETPIEDHYVVNHFETPVLDAGDHTISLSADGETVEIPVDRLRTAYPTGSVAHTMQCAGNGRAYFHPEIPGYSFSFGALGTSVWTGTPVQALLERHGIRAKERWLTVAGADGPEAGSDRVYARSIPGGKAVEDCLLAYLVGGDPLPLDHGFPVRLIVPGWYGNNCVKWVSEIRIEDGMVTDGREAGAIGGDGRRKYDPRKYARWQQQRYRLLPADAEPTARERIEVFDTREQIEAFAVGDVEYHPFMYDQTVKSLIGRPTDGTAVEPRQEDGRIEVVGVAWAGDDRVDRVEVSADGGDTWNGAAFFGPDRGPAAWRRFRYLWDPSPGEYTIQSRATDEHGRTQPASIAPPEDGFEAIREGRYPWNQRGYGSNAYEDLGVTVTVESE